MPTHSLARPAPNLFADWSPPEPPAPVPAKTGRWSAQDYAAVTQGIAARKTASEIAASICRPLKRVTEVMHIALEAAAAMPAGTRAGGGPPKGQRAKCFDRTTRADDASFVRQVLIGRLEDHLPVMESACVVGLARLSKAVRCDEKVLAEAGLSWAVYLIRVAIESLFPEEHLETDADRENRAEALKEIHEDRVAMLDGEDADEMEISNFLSVADEGLIPWSNTIPRVAPEKLRALCEEWGKPAE